MHKLLARQIKRTLDADGEQAIDSRLWALGAAIAPDHPDARASVAGLRELFERVDQTYEQHDRDITLRTRSLSISSAEANEAVQRMREESEARNRAQRCRRRP